MTKPTKLSVFQAALSRKPITLLTLGYIIGLSIIAGMSVGAHLIVNRVVEQQSSAARMINVAGRQRMLSQRAILFMTDAIDHKDVSAESKLIETINLMARSNDALTKGSKDMNIPAGMSERLQEIYYRAPYNLNQSVEQFIADARGIITALDANDVIDKTQYERAKDMAKTTLLHNLDVAVKAYEKDADDKIQELIKIQSLSIIVILIAIILEGIVIFRPLINRVEKYSTKMKEIATTDALTNIANRRAFFDFGKNELKRAERHKLSMALIVCDLDHFKAVNDTYGHQAGDDVLKHFTKIVKKNLRDEDIFGRVGGEEFAILLPHTDLKAAQVVAEKVRAVIEKYPAKAKVDGKKIDIPVSASFGLTLYDINIDERFEDVYVRADKALYAAKHAGRNRVKTG